MGSILRLRVHSVYLVAFCKKANSEALSTLILVTSIASDKKAICSQTKTACKYFLPQTRKETAGR